MPPDALIRRYDRNGPRYTSYPTAPQFNTGFGVDDYRAAAQRANRLAAGAPLSLYVHIPFCASPCFYCGCTKVITRRPEAAGQYLQRLTREIALQAPLFAAGRSVEQLHFGGGTPTHLSPAQLGGLLDTLGRHFSLSGAAHREFSIEIDPRTLAPGQMAELAALGFNRASFGVQDFDPAVQRAVNREQSEAMVAALMESARAAGLNSLSVDLIYGLPLQTAESFGRTLDQVVRLRPDRISAYSYAHLPERFKAQRRIVTAQLPDAATKLALLRLTTERLLDAGYVHIGMDHFALPGDELARALEAGTLQRNFQGYSTRGGLDLVGLGMSAIGRTADSFSQNARELDAYYALLDAGRLAVQRGILLGKDDQVRRDVIAAVMCSGWLPYAEVEARHGIVFADYFAAELRRLAQFQDDGLVELRPQGLQVTPMGRYLLRAIAMSFDAYLPAAAAQAEEQRRFSRVI
ncbi:MAG: oxygen-independent coproporphyrinogen III oxidase [Nevskia sp.]|nr:oxygen-independent coproporphyrinogen III oxidase [Nevskia sp.]